MKTFSKAHTPSARLVEKERYNIRSARTSQVGPRNSQRPFLAAVYVVTSKWESSAQAKRKITHTPYFPKRNVTGRCGKKKKRKLAGSLRFPHYY